MTDRPRTPRMSSATATNPTGHIHLTWTNPNPQPFTSVTTHHRGECEQCAQQSLWAPLNDPLLCGYHHDVATFAALPWWRRAITRKPKP